MFTRALSIALLCACATALTPLSAAGDDNECALYLSGPGRTSAYDYSLNLLKGNFGYEGQHTCITYDAVNQAYLEARNRILVSQPKGDWKAEDFASVGELILDISINLARTYGLTYEEIEKGLPLIDTSRTLIREVCPPVFSHVECRAGKYRRLDGLCNNLQHPTWGATMAPFQRLIGPLFADGINAPRISHTGRDLPLSRVVSRTMHPDEGFHDHAGTVMVIAWGQFMDHDFTLTGTPLDPVNRNDPEECCKRPPHLKHPYCNEIRVPEDDYFYRLFGVKCIDFVRGFPSPRPGCRLGSRVPFNTLTGAIDGNTVYGVTEKFARKLRTGYGGLLRMNPVFKEYGLRDLLPLKLDIPDEGCTRPNKNMYCFEAGEIRVNEQLVLTVMHTLMAREHNRIANALAEVNPHWDDETLFQEARRINIAEIQHITYNEFLPILLGKDVMEKFGLTLEKEGYWNGYDPEVNPDVLDSFAAAAYRFGHSLLPTAVERWSKAHKFIASKRLSDLIRRPYDLYRAGVLDEYVMGLMNQVAQAMDDSITQEVTNHLFKKVGARFGMDLVSFNMQRGREFGLPGYMEFRKFCGLPGAESFQDLFGTMSNETVRKYESIFEHPIDVDLWSGGVSERPLPGSMLGPTFACVIATQFSYSRRGDRFWYELPNQPSTFTPEQLTEIRKARLARVICDNTDIIDTVQLYPMVLPDHELNPRVPCRSGIIPSIDFTKWAEPAPFHGSAKQFMTDAQSFKKNDTNCDRQVSTTHLTAEVNATNEIMAEKGNNCNTTHDFQPPLKSNLVNLQISLNRTTKNNFTRNDDHNNCSQNVTACQDQPLSNEITDSDTVLKYVYKTNDKSNNIEKSKPNVLNSLRKKRSVDNNVKLENITGDESKTAPLIVNYETLHPPELSQSQRSLGSPIQNSALADFNIETLHKINSPKSNNKFEERSVSQSNEDSNESRNNEQSNEGENSSKSRESGGNYNSSDRDDENNNRHRSDEHPTYKTKEKYTSGERDESNENSESKEKGDYYRRDDKYSDSNENNNYRQRPVHLKSHSGESRESNEKYSEQPRRTNEESRESRESSDSVEHNKSSYKDDSREVNEKDDYKNDQSSYKNDSHEKSNVNSINPVKEDNHENRNFESKNTSEQVDEYPNKGGNNAPSFRDVDLGDFSFERIQVDEKGKVVPAKDSEDFNSARPIVDPQISKPKSSELKQTSSEDSLGGGIYEIHKEPVSINDGEIKPVVEINSEAIDSQEDHSKEALKSNPHEDTSLESLLGTNNKERNLEIGKTVEDKSENDKIDVKQQFERIPSNYNHDNSNRKKNEKETENINQTDDSNSQKGGTLDSLEPINVNFDENLRFKFDDIQIKLPAINLPDDILSYAYEGPTYEKNRDKQKETPRFYQYRKENDPKAPTTKQRLHKHDDDKEDEYQGYYGYYGDNNNQKYTKKEKDDEENSEEIDDDRDDDLYEKFVRERFGKSGSFQKRSEKLQAASIIPKDEKLYDTVKNILKQTQEIQKQADKSGDPKAGYMWTLEYGEHV